MATHSSIPAWEIPRTEEPGGLSPWGCKRALQDLATKQQPIYLTGLVCSIDYGSLQPPVDLVSGSAVSPGAPCQGRGEGLASGLSDPGHVTGFG